MVIENKDLIHLGKVSWFNKTKGFGVIIDEESGEEVFIHHSDIVSNGKFVILEDQELVNFKLQTRENKVCAIQVTPKNGHFQNEREFKKNDHNSQRKGQRIRNTTDFNPSHTPPDMRIVYQHGGNKFQGSVTVRDVILVSGLFDDQDNIYQQLSNEISQSGLSQNQLWKSWHGDTHFIADDHLGWKKSCPTFQKILSKISDYFEMNIKATRLNHYNDSNEWKPFHHDAAAVKKDKAETQNFTVAVSFGLEREAAFQHAKTGTVLSIPCPNGSVYVFSRDVNIIWKHGIRQMKSQEYVNQGRYSIIAWGWKKMMEM
jgi:cold shock CspA family protein